MILPRPCSRARLGAPEVAVRMRVEDIAWGAWKRVCQFRLDWRGGQSHGCILLLFGYCRFICSGKFLQ